MSAGEPHAGAPPFHNHINTSVLNQLKQRFEEVPESIVIKVLKEVRMSFYTINGNEATGLHRVELTG